MKFSEAWLRQWVNPDISSAELMAQLTMAGLEVDGSEPAAPMFAGVVVGDIVSCEPHPHADKLQVCQVSVGDEAVSVVCGAANARAGIKVAFARVGAQLPGDIKIGKAKLRQVESFGMLCSERELGLSDNHAGIMELPLDAPAGDDLRTYLGLDDQVIEVDLTPNRADCFSIRGLAREVATLNQQTMSQPTVSPLPAVHDQQFEVRVKDPVGCPRYLGRVLQDVNVSAATPLWLAERLRRSGIRSIDPVVDVTNYVMLELGQPMHGFDLARLEQYVEVRRARAGETITLLNGQETTLDEAVLLIADARGALAIAGIMGGADSGVSADTKEVFLEAAFFTPTDIAGKARSFGLHTESSQRFERGVDPALQELAIERATALLVEICGARPGPLTCISSAADCPQPAEIELSAERLASALGLRMADQEIKRILRGLEFEILTEESGLWRVKAPSWRFDMSIQADLIEEIARIYGYNRFPVSAPTAELKPRGKGERQVDAGMLVDRLVSLGYQEAITYSFVEPKAQQALFPSSTAPALANPISADMAVMRVSLWPGLLQAMQHNLNRQQPHVRLFEMGLVFNNQGAQLEQTNRLAAAVTGGRLAAGWYEDGTSVDFYDVKGDLEQLLALIKGVRFSFTQAEHSALHPGQSAAIVRAGQILGYVGALHPSLAQAYGFKQPLFLFEMSLDKTLAAELPAFRALSKQPLSSRDLAVVVDEEIAVETVLDCVREMAGEALVGLNLFDIYRGKGIDSKRKSLAIGLTWQHPSRTLTDKEVDGLIEQIVTALQTRHNAVLRG